MFTGHKSEDGRIQALRDHLTGVASMAAEFAQAFDAPEHAFRTGILHDAGKYSEAGQKRMNDPEHTAKTDHSTAGAKIALEQLKDPCGAIAVAGHHGGMPDFGGKFSAEGDGTLRGRCKKSLEGPNDPSAFWQENKIDDRNVFPSWLKAEKRPFSYSFYTRMLFSCLVDADYLDTEAFMKAGAIARGQYESVEKLFQKVQQYIRPWMEKPKNDLNRKRNEILRNCLDASKRAPGLFSLTVPTGGGKTISSLAFALSHAYTYGLSRVIYVIPYTSIIEQNAEIFRKILGDENVLEHHSGTDMNLTEEQEDDYFVQRKKLATENWDAPVIVTTAVQFFESLFSNKPAKCRKLHNISNSVIIFDEAQMMPLSYLKPCVWAIAELVRHYGVTAVLCTATQPSLNRLFAEYDPAMHIREICENVSDLQAFFRRVHFLDSGQMKMDSLGKSMLRHEQILCIVNSRKNAQLLFSQLPFDGSYHLSTWMTPLHRSETLKEIRSRLDQGQTCRVVSTSLLEAGVDLDFPGVYREKAGLDSILQAAGRCNREGKRAAEASEVVLFSLEGGVPKEIQPNRAAADIAMDGAKNPDDHLVIETYFQQLYRLRGEGALDLKAIIDMCLRYEYQAAAQAFHLIEAETYPVYIPRYLRPDDLAALHRGEYSRALMRRAGRSAVNVSPWIWEKLIALRAVEEQSGLLLNEKLYDERCGLNLNLKTSEAFFEE